MSDFVWLTNVPVRALLPPVMDLLEQHGIEVYVKSDDCGSVYPSLTFIHGIQVHVARRDLQKAKKLLAKLEAQHRRSLDDPEPGLPS
jgi:hypothetical protein